MSRKDRITLQLGMSHGAAAGKLKKNILFKFVQNAKQDVCFKCNKLIESVDDFSIEHKVPWEGSSVELFWDLDNIAFSHLHCNRPHSRKAGTPRKIGPNNTAWCYDCKLFIPIENFYKNKSRWDGLDDLCKEHKKKATKF